MKPSVQANHMVLGQLYTNAINDKRVLQAMVDVPRELFLPEGLRGSAYVDEDLPLGKDRYMLEPLSAARLIAYADISESSRVMVIGVYNGYVAALAAKIAHHVVATDTDTTALESAKVNLEKLSLSNVNLQTVKSLADGYALSAPYDAIIIAGAVEFIPESLASQLSIHGRLTAIRNVASRPGMQGGLGKGVIVTRAAGQLQHRDIFDASTPLLPGFKSQPAFSL